MIHVPPPGVIDQTGYVHLPIRIADYLNEPSYNPTLVQKLRNKTAKKADQKPRWITMTQADYQQYWAKDETSGSFSVGVQEPPQGRVEWLRLQVRLNDEWRSWGQIKDLANSQFSAIIW